MESRRWRQRHKTVGYLFVVINNSITVFKRIALTCHLWHVEIMFFLDEMSRLTDLMTKFVTVVTLYVTDTKLIGFIRLIEDKLRRSIG